MPVAASRVGEETSATPARVERDGFATVIGIAVPLVTPWTESTPPTEVPAVPLPTTATAWFVVSVISVPVVS